jgi:hypothetical protein
MSPGHQFGAKPCDAPPGRQRRVGPAASAGRLRHPIRLTSPYREVIGGGEGRAPSAPEAAELSNPVPQQNDLSRSLVAFEQNSTLGIVTVTGWRLAGR